MAEAHAAIDRGRRSSRPQAAVNQAQLNLSHTVITAPIDGIVIGRSVDVGQTVAASLSSPTMFTIAADLAEMQVSASIDESDIGRIRPAQRGHLPGGRVSRRDASPARSRRCACSRPWCRTSRPTA